jgi:putative ABC transport system permease protein
VTIDDRPTTIVGVMPPDFELHNQEEIWLTLGPERGDNGRGNHGLTVIGRLKTGVPLSAGIEDARSVANQLEKEFSSNEGEGILPVSFTDWLVTKDFRRALWLLSGAVAFLLLITCSNIANLLLARSTQRRTEMAIRSALGATSSRLMRQLLTESAMLSGIGGVLGALSGAWLIYALKLFGSTRIPRLQQVTPDVGVFAATMALALVCGLIFGLAPALRVARADVNSDLKQSGRTGSAGRPKDYLRSLLVVSEVALSFILLAGAGLLIHSYWLAVNVSPGFSAQNLLTARFSLPRSRYSDPAKTVAMLGRVEERVRAIPGVERVGFTDYAPFHETSNPSMEVHVDGEAQSANHAPASSGYRDVSPGYLEALAVPLLTGRTFTASDTSAAPLVAVVSRSFAERFFPDGAIGKVFHPGDPKEKPVSIVGVVGDAAYSNIEEPPGPMFYLSALQNRWFQAATFAVRSSAPNDQITNGVREALRAEDPTLALFGVQQMDELIATSFTGRKFNLLLLGSFAGMALLLAIGGIFGVVSYTVTQRTQEIGIRMSVGAEPSDILRLMVGQGMLPVAVGLGLGIVGALSLTRLMSSLLYAIPAHDPFTYAAVSTIFVLAAFLACALPAYRAAHIDPMVALRRD